MFYFATVFSIRLPSKLFHFTFIQSAYRECVMTCTVMYATELNCRTNFQVSSTCRHQLFVKALGTHRVFFPQRKLCLIDDWCLNYELIKTFILGFFKRKLGYQGLKMQLFPIVSESKLKISNYGVAMLNSIFNVPHQLFLQGY